MRYVVTGGCGFIGSTLSTFLNQRARKLPWSIEPTNRELIDQKTLLQDVQHFYGHE